jgi:hypothetical protein
VQLPLAKTLIALRFLTGLLPVIGNLISNTVITIVGLSLSISVAASALVFLVIIHKLEYFLNARIVGSRINARATALVTCKRNWKSCSTVKTKVRIQMPLPFRPHSCTSRLRFENARQKKIV